MTEIPQAEKDRIVKALSERGAATSLCPRCGGRNLTLLGGYFNQPLQTGLSSFDFSGPSIPSAVVACAQCGYLMQHALGVLGLLSTSTKDGGSGEEG